MPRLVGGVRMVSLLGDAEDRRSITADAIDGMMVSSLDVVVRKYGAPAIALAVTDGRSVAVAGYAPGYAASWQPVYDASDPVEAQRRSVETLASMFGGNAGPAAVATEATAPSYDADIVDAIERTDGTYDYVLSLSVRGQGPDDIALRLEALPGARLKAIEGAPGKVRATVSYDAPHDAIADDLSAAGFSVR